MTSSGDSVVVPAEGSVDTTYVMLSLLSNC
jgi:hypothetical protein